MLTELLQQMSTTVIGVSIETDALRIAESHAGHVVRCVSKPYPPGIMPGSEEMAGFLRQSLAGFGLPRKKVPVWVVGHLPSLQTRFLVLPTGRRRGLSDMAYWTFRKDLPFDAEQTLFDYGIEGEGDSDGTTKLHVTAYTALRAEVEALQAVFIRTGIRLAGIVIPAFAMRAVMQGDKAERGGVRFGVFAGDEASTMIIVKDGQVCSSRVFKTGMQALLGVVHAAEPDCPLPVAYARVRSLLAGAGQGPGDPELETRVREVFDRLVQQIERTLKAYLNEHPADTIAGMYVMGPLAGFAPLVAEMCSRLGVEVMVPEAVRDEQAELASQGGLEALALGAALSHPDRTPSLLCPSSRREQAARRSWLSILVALLLGLAGALLHLSRGVIDFKNAQLGRNLETEQARLAGYVPVVDEALLQALTAKRVTEHARWKQQARRWLAPAILHALGPLTPESIRLSEIELDFGVSGQVSRGRGRGEVKARSGVLKLKGFVRGVQDAQRSTLAAYALRLEGSPLFARASVRHVTDGQAGGEAAVLFEIEVDVEGGVGVFVAPTSSPAGEVQP